MRDRGHRLQLSRGRARGVDGLPGSRRGGVDVDQEKIESLSQAIAPFHEPGFEELLADTLATGRLRFSTDFADAAGSQVHFVCVGTPQKRGEYAADLRYVEAATESLVGVLAPGNVEFGCIVRQKRVLDGRNARDREAWTAAGWSYRALGRRAG